MCGTDCFLMLLSVLFPPIGGMIRLHMQAPGTRVSCALTHKFTDG
jgi:uncharacterized membrane protein YqaE (UPF0057 family)